jgi:ABC-2 type transport system permease protein
LDEIALLYGLVHVSFALSEGAARGSDTFHLLVRWKDFDRLLVPPRPTGLQVAGQEWQLMRVGRPAQGAVVLAWACHALEFHTAPAAAAAVLWTCLGCTCIFAGLPVLQATFAFRTVEGLNVFNAVTYGGVETAQYPLEICWESLRTLFVPVIPLARVSYHAAHLLLLRRSLPLAALLLRVAPGAGNLVLLAALGACRFGERRNQSAGG